MTIRIIDFETGIDFDLNDDIKISVVKTNPFISDGGSISLPLSLKWTERNVELLGFPHRYDRKFKYSTKRDVVVIYGVDQSRATMVVNAVQKNVQLVCTLLFEESEIYLKMRDVSMRQVFSGIVREDYTGTQSERVTQWIEHFESVMGGLTDDDFYVYPVCVKLTNELEGVEYVTSFILLNEQNADDPTGGLNSYYKFKNRVAGTFIEDGVEIAYPAGYRITGFLKLSFVLQKVFEYFGYTLNYDFESDLTFSKITIPNKTNDLLLPGKIMYDQMVPTVSVEKFIEVVRKTYHVEFIPVGNGEVEMIKFDDTLDFDDISEIISSEPVIEPEAFKSLFISCKRGFDIQNSDYTNRFDFDKAFPSVIELNIYFEDRADGIYFLKPSGLFFEKKTSSGIGYIFVLGNNNFDYYQEIDDAESYDVSCDFESLPMVNLRVQNDDFIAFPFISNEISMNSKIKLETENKKSVDASKNDCPIMFCFYAGRAVGNDNYENRVHGTTQHYKNTGDSFADYDLVLSGSYGLYEKNWKLFNNILQNSFQPLKLNLNIDNISSFKMHKGKMLNGQPLIPELIKYEISSSGIKVIEAKFRTAKIYD